AARGLGVEIGVGAEAAGMDALDGAEVVDFVDVAGDAERTDDLARGIADELAAGLEEQRAVGELGQRLHEGRLLLRLLQHLPRRAVERERTERLAVGDLEAHERAAILLLERLPPPAGVEHDGGERVGLAFLRGGEGAFDGLVRLGQRNRTHSSPPWIASLRQNSRSHAAVHVVVRIRGPRTRRRPCCYDRDRAASGPRTGGRVARFGRVFAAGGVRMPRRLVALIATVAAALALTAAAAAA